MKFGTKEIKSLTDDELWDAIRSVGDMDKNRLDKLEKPRKRHAALFNKHPPTESPTFTQLVNELNQEFQSRNKTNA